ncbi:MAG: tetratricopeptide repeat protein [Kiritimatiellae bacterium]|nr:tetratricopeptide repeat protein [Kiritimatiellia bacterium]
MTFFAAVAAVVFASAAILPADRLAMADRMFGRGDRKGAKAEYAALRGADGIAQDELLFRLAECCRADGDLAGASEAYGELLAKHPLSRHVPRARLMKALSSSPEEKAAALRLLDTDATPSGIRAAALYHLGVETSDAAALAKCAEVEPDGRYAPYARLRRAALLSNAADAKERRAAIGELLEIHRSGDPELAPRALYLAASAAYAGKRYDEAAALYKKYAKAYPSDAQTPAALNFAAWSEYLAGRYAEAAALCEGGETDDAAYILAMCAYRTGDMARTKLLASKYRNSRPDGKYFSKLELPLAAADRFAAEKSGDSAAFLAAARRCAELSGSPADALTLAWAYEKNSLPDAAAEAYANTARKHPATAAAAEALFRKAAIDIRASRWRPAELALAELLAIAGGNPELLAPGRKGEALYWRGYAAARLGLDEQAAASYSRALAEGVGAGEALEARIFLASAAQKAGRDDEAAKAWVELAADGAAKRMDGAELRSVARFLLDSPEAGTAAAASAAVVYGAELAAISKTPEWRQCAFALLGDANSAAGNLSAAVGAYRQAMAENVRTADAKTASLSLGVLLARSGETAEAEKHLKEAVSLNPGRDDAGRRANAYLWLARCRDGAGDAQGACAYATVVSSLFANSPEAAEAAKILAAHPEESK